MANRYHSLKLFRLLIGDVSQALFSNMIGFDAAHVCRIEAGYRINSARMRDAIKALMYPLVSTDDVELLLSGEMKVEDVHRLAEAYARVRELSATGPGGSNHGKQSADASGASEVCPPAQPTGDRPAVQDDAGPGVEGGTRASA